MSYSKGNKRKPCCKRMYTMKRKRRGKRRVRRRKSRKMRGGGNQFLSNVARSTGYSIGSELDPNMSALANPAPFFAYKKCV